MKCRRCLEEVRDRRNECNHLTYVASEKLYRGCAVALTRRACRVCRLLFTVHEVMWVSSRPGRHHIDLLLFSCSVNFPARGKITMLHLEAARDTANDSSGQDTTEPAPPAPGLTRSEERVARYNERNSGRRRRLSQVVKDAPWLWKRYNSDIARGDKRILAEMMRRGVHIHIITAAVYLMHTVRRTQSATWITKRGDVARVCVLSLARGVSKKKVQGANIIACFSEYSLEVTLIILCLISFRAHPRRVDHSYPAIMGSNLQVALSL